MASCKSCKGSGVLFGKPCFKCSAGASSPRKKKKRKNPDATTSSVSSSKSGIPWKTIGSAAATVAGLSLAEVLTFGIFGPCATFGLGPPTPGCQDENRRQKIGRVLVLALVAGGAVLNGALKKPNSIARGVLYGVGAAPIAAMIPVSNPATKGP